MNTLSQLLHGKGNQVWSIGPDATVYDAIHLMAEKGIGALVVLKDESLVGVISERDYARDVVLKDRSSKETLVKEIMSDKVVYADPHQTVDECLAVMTEKRIIVVMPGGNITMIVPAPNFVARFETVQAALDAIIAKVVPKDAVETIIVDEADIPERKNATQVFRNAWEWDTNSRQIIINPAKIKPRRS